MTQDVPSPIEFADIEQARAWVARTVQRRPARPRFFEAFATSLNAHFDRPARIAELGSGPGHLARAILQSCAVASYAALDLSPAMHALAREHIGEESGRVRFVIADFCRPDWADGLGQIDALVTMQAAHEVRHKSRLPGLLEQARETIAPRGLLLFCDHYAEDGSGKNAELFVTRDEQTALLTNAGFEAVRTIHDEGGMALYSARRPMPARKG